MRRIRKTFVLGVTSVCTASLAVSVVSVTPAGATFPGVNGKLAFVSDRDGPDVNAEIYTMSADGTGVTRLTNVSPAGDLVSPGAWSPDGSKLVFTSNRSGAGEIYTMNADGSGVTQLTDYGANANEAAWSPDGTKITFYSSRGGNYDIFTIDADGSDETRLTDDPGVDASPNWSPDGSTILFQANRDATAEIYVMDADGSDEVNLTNTSSYSESGGNWSPDGMKITYHGNLGGDVELFVMDADGSGQTQLTNNAANDSSPSISPDGTTIAFVSDRDGDSEIFTMDLDGTDQTQVTMNTADDGGTAWQPLPETNAPPDCAAAAASGATLWPANHEMRTVSVVGVTDPDGDPVVVTIDSIFQDEPVNGTGDGDTAPDGVGVATADAHLRAERAGSGNGRVYHVGFSADDGRGGSCAGEVTVGVPRDMGKNRVPIDGGALYDSTG